MEPAASIIQKLGGPNAVAEAAGTAYTAPYRWKSSITKGGTGGAIPRKYIPKLLSLANRLGVSLSPADFVAIPAFESRSDAETSHEAILNSRNDQECA